VSQPTAQEIVQAYLQSCRPPINASTSDVVTLVEAWNAIVAQLAAAEPKP
jgi:hypothetical protein